MEALWQQQNTGSHWGNWWTIIWPCNVPALSRRPARVVCGPAGGLIPYSPRHAMPTEALEHEADVKAVAEVMGHAGLTMLLRVYQHTRFRLRKKADNAASGLGIKPDTP